MPHGKTHFQTTWLTKTETNGHCIGQCLKEDKTPYTAYTVTCILCSSSFKCDNSGLRQIMSHADGKGHKTIGNQRFCKTDKHFFEVRKSRINCVTKEEPH